jgi:hypothetical protein
MVVAFELLLNLNVVLFIIHVAAFISETMTPSF